MKRILIVFISLLLSFFVIPAKAAISPSSSIPPIIQQQLNSMFNNWVSNQQLVGAIVAIYKDGKVQYYAYGKTARNGNLPTPATVYQIASITKVFTSTLLAQAVVNKKVTLDEPIDNYLPKGIHLQPGVANRITFQELATHTASLPNSLPATIKTPADFFNYLSSWQPPYPIGTKDKYSNVGFQLLAYLITTIEQQNYQQLLNTEIAQPIGMRATQSITQPLPAASQLAQAYSVQNEAISYQRSPWDGVGFLISNAADLMRFVQANLGVLLLPENLSEAISLTQQSYFSIKPQRAQGLAWEIFMMQQPGYQVKIYWKNGSVPGFASFIGFNPVRQTGVVILASQNLQNTKQIRIANQITKVGIQSLRAL